MSEQPHTHFDKKEILAGAIGCYKDYCDGFGCPQASGNGYILGIVLGVGKDKIQFSHAGSQVLDEINTFDLAEIDSAYIGQLNMSLVSSFCGPQGLIWGYDLAQTDIQSKASSIEGDYQNLTGEAVPVFSAWPLIEATKKLFGTRDQKLFPIKPGSHVPFAGKSLKFEGPKRIYSAIGIGVPRDRSNAAVLLMEDLGWIPALKNGISVDKYKSMILDGLVRSVLKVGDNQQVVFQSIYVALKDIEIGAGEMGCALVAAPYFTLAQNAVPGSGTEALVDTTLEEWLRAQSSQETT